MTKTNLKEDLIIEKVADTVLKKFMEMGIDELFIAVERLVLERIKENLSRDQWARVMKSLNSKERTKSYG